MLKIDTRNRNPRYGVLVINKYNIEYNFYKSHIRDMFLNTLSNLVKKFRDKNRFFLKKFWNNKTIITSSAIIQ